MSHLRLNLLTGRWVTIVSSRAKRPTDFAPRTAQVESDPSIPCPFCPEHQIGVPAILERLDSEGNWQQRIIPNLYPAFDGDEAFAVHHHGPVHIAADASGMHEVFILSPRHNGRPEGDTADDAVQALLLLKQRLQQHAQVPNVRYTQAIINHGREAGASMAHPHAQLLGLPFVPGELVDEQRAFSRFEGGCILCATIQAELVDGERIISADDDVVTVCPYWSESPYEMLIIPRHHDLHITDATDEQVAAIGLAVREAVSALRAAHGDIAFNIVLHTAPHHYQGDYHWHIHLYPTLVTTAGFERGTGVMINIVPPELAAEHLRRIPVNA